MMLQYGVFMKNIKRLVLLIAISTALAACKSTPPSAPKTLLGSWLVSSINDKTVIAKSTAQLKFTPKNMLSGSASCNNISSSYSSQKNAVNIGPITTTRKMCLPALMIQEAIMLQALSKVRRFQLNNDQLSMFDQQGTLQLKAKRTK
jgi:heat shock protein HslJ